MSDVVNYNTAANGKAQSGPSFCFPQVAVLYALLTAKGGVFSGQPAAADGSPSVWPSALPGSSLGHGGGGPPGSGSMPAGGLPPGEAGAGDYWAARYANLQHEVQDMQARVEAIAQAVAAALASLRAEGSSAQRSTS